MMLSQVTFSEEDVLTALRAYMIGHYNLKNVEWDYDDIHYEGHEDRMLTIGLATGIEMPKEKTK